MEAAAGVPLPRQIQISFRIVVLGTVKFGEKNGTEPTGRASNGYAGSLVTMRKQVVRRLFSKLGRHTIRRSPSFSLAQNLFRDVSGMLFPLGVRGTVAQNNPNTQPEETE
jgi:hypothetical protein